MRTLQSIAAVLLAGTATGALAQPPSTPVAIRATSKEQAAQLAEQRRVAAERQRVETERAERAYRRWVTDELTPFESESEFRRYLTDLQAYRRTPLWWAEGGRRVQFAQAGQSTDQDPPVDEPCTDPTLCPENSDEMNVIVTGTRARSSNPSITNNQEASVEEGDIVKQIGQFLLVLQDGRIFSVDTRGGTEHRELVLADRANVYRSADQGIWYDEMLVSDDRILITGYDYDRGETELSVFRLDQGGRLHPEGRFYIRSYDYYDHDNYATRLVDGRLVVYTPIDPSDILDGGRLKWPVVRRWRANEDPDEPEGDPLIDVRQVYRPLTGAGEALIHAVSVCPLGTVSAGRNLRCETRGFIGPQDREFYVSDNDAFMWVTDHSGRSQDDAVPSDDCTSATPRSADDGMPAILYRVPLSGDEASVAGVRGDPIDQFSLQTSGNRFRALVRDPSRRCTNDDESQALSYVSLGLDRFAPELRQVAATAYTPMPQVSGSIENRFTDAYLVYGGREGYSGYPPEEGLRDPSRVYAVPIDRPRNAHQLHVRHNLMRVERAGDNIVLTGYESNAGLDLSVVDLRAAPRVAATTRLEGRYESEGRSHAFNSLVDQDGSGLMGLPTVERRWDSGRWWWRSRASDVSYLSVDSSGQLTSLGALETSRKGNWNEEWRVEDDSPANGYSCEVSCIDWYGNSRPIFTDGRVFGLTGTELVEGRLAGGRISEVQRLDITRPPSVTTASAGRSSSR